MKKLFLTFAACAALIGANAETTWKMGDNTFNVDTLFHATTGPGVTTTGLRLTGADSSVNTIKTNVFYSTIDLTNPTLELHGVQAQDHPDKTESVLSMGNRKNKAGQGQYITGINGDFFNMGGSPTRTNGHSLVDGKLYNVGVGGAGWEAWASYATVEHEKDIRIMQGVSAQKNVKFPNGQLHSYHINGGRWNDYLVIYTSDSISTGTNVWGSECPMKLVSGSLTDGDAVFEITGAVVGNVGAPGNGNMTVPRDGFVLSGVGNANAMMAQLKVGDHISLGTTVYFNGNVVEPQQVIGGCSMIVMDGQVADSKYFSGDIIDHFTSNQARSVIGYNQDRSKLIILVADKYTKYATSNDVVKVTDPDKLSYGTSTGFAMRRMGQLMVNLGCYTAMAFDGGGSSQLYNNKLGICNVPYGDTYLRPVANGFFAVSNTPEDNEIAAIEVSKKNVSLNNGEKFTPRVYGYNKYGVLVDTDVANVTFTVASELGKVEGTTLTAGAAAKSTHAVVSLGDLKCGVRIYTNGGGDFVTSGDDSAPLTVSAPYESDEPIGIDKDPFFMAEKWHFVNEAYNDGWDGTAPDWTSTDAIKSKPCPRFATARNGRFYTVDMTTMSIAEIDNEGNLHPLYKLPALDGEYSGVKDYYGCAISSDDAGNFLIGHLFTKPETYNVWTIYSPKTGLAKHFTLPTGDGLSSGRIDNVGRVVGDLTQDAYVYVAPKATGSLESQRAHIIHFTGNGSISSVEATNSFSTGLYLAGSGNTASTCQPKYDNVESMKGIDLNDTFYWYSKAEGINQYTVDLFTFNNGTYSVNYALNWENYSALNGFDTFTLAGKRYFVLAYADATEFATTKSGQHIIVKDEQGTTVAEWNNPDYTSSAGYNTITAVKMDENNVNIYIYNCTGNFAGKGSGNGAIAGALLRVSTSPIEDEEMVEITPEGLDFDSYADGTPFKLTASESNGGWSAPAGLYHVSHPNAFEEDGQLTVYLDRGAALDRNTQDYVDNTMQKAFIVRKMNDNVGNVLAVSQPWSPGASMLGWESAGYAGAQAQLSFYARNEEITNKPDQRHYIRVQVVYNILLRGCHYAQDLAAGGPKNLMCAIYATHENNWVVPANDHELGARYADTGIDFAKWVDETGNVEDIPAEPQVYQPNGEVEPWDNHTDNNENRAYLINDERYRVYEFDTYMDKPSANTISVQLNLLNRNTNYLIKEIRFFDLGTDESAATLLGRRQTGWRYYNAAHPNLGVEDVIAAEDDATPVYYNLQGIQIANPDNGIYIVRRGNKVTKEYIRK